MADAKKNGQILQPFTPEQLANSKVQVAADNGNAKLQSALTAAQERERVALEKLNNPNSRSSSMQQMYDNRMLSAADGASGALESIAAMPFGTRTGWLARATGTTTAGESLFDLTSQNMRQAVTSDDAKLYNTFTTGLGMNIAMLEKQGGLAGGQNFAKQILANLQLLPTDSPLVVMGKLAEARASIDRNLEITMARSNLDPTQKELMQQRLDQMHAAIPFTRADVIAF